MAEHFSRSAYVMFSTSINPDFRKLTAYFNDLTDDRISLLEKNGGVHLNLEYITETEYSRINSELLNMLTKLDIRQHHTELLYLIIKKYESLEERIEALWRNYDDDLKSREVARFLLAYKASSPTQEFHLSAKPITGSATIKDTAIARWMAEQIYLAVERKNYTLDLFGEKLIYNLFGDVATSEKEISIYRLTTTANLKVRKPTVLLNKLYVEFCLHLLTYLNEETLLTASENIKLTNDQGRFLFNVMALVGYIDPEKIASPPDSYVASLFQRYVS